jgi:hypothetical protein
MSRDHRRKREPIAAILARRQADLDRVWNEAKRCRYGASKRPAKPKQHSPLN